VVPAERSTNQSDVKINKLMAHLITPINYDPILSAKNLKLIPQ
jgi:hypothetical protein